MISEPPRAGLPGRSSKKPEPECGDPPSPPEEQRYLILECKVGIFEEVVHQDDEFAHDGGAGDFGGFACGAEPLVKLFELPVGAGGNQCGHVERPADGCAPAADAPASVPLPTLTWMRGQSSQRRRLATVERAQFRQF